MPQVRRVDALRCAVLRAPTYFCRVDGEGVAWSVPGGLKDSSGASADDLPYYDDGYLPELIHPDYLYDNCKELDAGSIALNGTRACNLVVSGIDTHVSLGATIAHT